MNELEIKKVPFLGTELMAARDSDGQIWAGVSYICRGIGLSKNEKDRQIKNVQADKVLSKGCGKFDAGVFDPNNLTVALKLDFIPLWLAKISITPTMEQETPELAEALMQYQLRAKDVLAAAFVPDVPIAADYQRENLRFQKAELLNRIAGDYDGTYKQILQAYAAKELTGAFVLPLPALERKTYSAKEIGALLGVSSKKIGALANKNGLKTDEYGKWFVDKSPYSSKEVQAFRYYDSVLPVLQELI